jgi:ribosomal protein S21
MLNVEVKAKENESTTNLLRRFSRKVNSSGILRRKRSLKTRKRDVSKNVRKQQKVQALEKRDQVEKMIKLGKLPDRRAKYKGVS